MASEQNFLKEIEKRETDMEYKIYVGNILASKKVLDKLKEWNIKR